MNSFIADSTRMRELTFELGSHPVYKEAEKDFLANKWYAAHADVHKAMTDQANRAVEMYCKVAYIYATYGIDEVRNTAEKPVRNFETVCDELQEKMSMIENNSIYSTFERPDDYVPSIEDKLDNGIPLIAQIARISTYAKYLLGEANKTAMKTEVLEETEDKEDCRHCGGRCCCSCKELPVEMDVSKYECTCRYCDPCNTEDCKACWGCNNCGYMYKIGKCDCNVGFSPYPASLIERPAHPVYPAPLPTRADMDAAYQAEQKYQCQGDCTCGYECSCEPDCNCEKDEEYLDFPAEVCICGFGAKCQNVIRHIRRNMMNI